jgi:hypothetical protein
LHREKEKTMFLDGEVILTDEHCQDCKNMLDDCQCEDETPQIEPEWHTSDEDCPKCQQATQRKYGAGSDGHIYELGERCTKCGWVIIFDELDLQ